jgi:hypothetical protein
MAAAAADAFFTYKIIHTQYRLFGLGTLLRREAAAAAKRGIRYGETKATV